MGAVLQTRRALESMQFRGEQRRAAWEAAAGRLPH
jgi:hypothetical protein